MCRYNRNFHEALEELNQARKDGEWGSKAICHMIDIYLDPEQLGEDASATSPVNDKVSRGQIFVSSVCIGLIHAYGWKRDLTDRRRNRST